MDVYNTSIHIMICQDTVSHIRHILNLAKTVKRDLTVNAVVALLGTILMPWCLNKSRRYGIDPTKIKNDLGWYPETPFEKGIVLTIDWYLEHEEWMKNVTSGNYQKYYEEMYKAKAEVRA